ncbi:tetratricopeptide repeat protein [Bacillus niameyensis]|uniref:tetratricopeptide repeat protein n=1 Tax=Bacillus niameyensis TaxID=1522308 RepID=UPI00078593E9|nr:tetratricopeptide repeat protein [Bacillus niameyensis]
MGREHGERVTGKIIPFPKLKQRYFEKGLACMDEHNFKEAVMLLKSARDLDPQDPQIVAAYLAALYENGDYDESKQVAEELLYSGTGHYYDILDIYLMILIQLNEFDQVVNTLEPLFEENEVPPEKAEHFLTLLQLSKKATANRTTIDESKIDYVFDKKLGLHEQLLQLGTLTDKNIRPYLHSLIDLLSDDHLHPILKTVILNVMRENQIEQQIVVKKLNRQGTFTPANLLLVQDMPLFKDMMNILEKDLGDHNPTLFNQISEMTNRHAFILYPFEASPEIPNVWAAAYRGMGYEMYGEDWEKEAVAENYGITMDELEIALAFIVQLEQISSTIV